jgi:membrane-bound lytic murein transglycosylase A
MPASVGLCGALCFALAVGLAVLSACATAPRMPSQAADAGTVIAPVAPGTSTQNGGVYTDSRSIIAANQVILLPVSYADLPGWSGDDFAQVWQAWLASCASAKRDATLAKPCAAAQANGAALQLLSDVTAQRAFFQAQFTPHRVSLSDNKDTGLLTGYYEPVLKGSRVRSAAFNAPLYGKPDDLLPLAVGDVAKSRRTPQGAVVPYWTRAEIDSGAANASVNAKAWVYLDDPIEALFLHIQGSGRIQLPDGQTVRAAYADNNGHPFKSIGQWLIQRGEMRLEDASMQSIKAWAQKNPARVNELLAANPRYIFFKEERITNPQEGPKGAMNVPLTAGRSIAVDTKAIALGLPVWVDSTVPLNNKPMQRLSFAQDIGAAITGAIRADLFWGTGTAAGEQAGRTKQPLKLYVLIPK